MKKMALAILSSVLVVSPILAGNSLLLGSSGTEIFIIDPVSGQRTALASTGLDSGMNLQFTVDSATHTAFLLGTRGGVLSISSVNLLTGAWHVSPISGYPVLRAYNGSLLGSWGTEIDLINPATGQRTFLATTGLDNGMNFQFTVDTANHTAFLLGERDDVLSISRIDLLTGTSHVFPFSYYPSLDTYNGSLLGSWGTEIDLIDPVTGQRTFLATTGLDTGMNFQFTVDAASHTAFLLGQRDDILFISSVNLLTGTSHLIPVSGYPMLEIYTVPEPGVAALALLAVVVAAFRSRCCLHVSEQAVTEEPQLSSGNQRK